MQNKYQEKYENDKDQDKLTMLKEFFWYIFDWLKKFYDNGILNYIYITKNQRSNSYVENYNRHSAVSRGWYCCCGLN